MLLFLIYIKIFCENVCVIKIKVLSLQCYPDKQSFYLKKD